MTISKASRAKQFLPFDSVKGLQESLREKEIEYEEKKELSEEILNELDNTFNRMENGSKVKIKYYKNYRYNEIEGIVTKIDIVKKKIQINNDYNINVSDILSIDIK